VHIHSGIIKKKKEFAAAVIDTNLHGGTKVTDKGAPSFDYLDQVITNFEHVTLWAEADYHRPYQ